MYPAVHFILVLLLLISLYDEAITEQWYFARFLLILFCFCSMPRFDSNDTSVDNVVRLIWPRSDNLTFWPQIAKTGQILTKKGFKVRYMSPRQIFMTQLVQFLPFKTHFQKIWCFAPYTSKYKVVSGGALSILVF